MRHLPPCGDPAARALSLSDACFPPCKSDPFAAVRTLAAPGSRRWVRWGGPLSGRVPEREALGVVPGQCRVKETGHQKAFSDRRLQRHKHLPCQVRSRKPFRVLSSLLPLQLLLLPARSGHPTGKPSLNMSPCAQPWAPSWRPGTRDSQDAESQKGGPREIAQAAGVRRPP